MNDNKTRGDDDSSAMITSLLTDWETGDSDRFIMLAYEDLRRIAKGLLIKESTRHTLQPTALVHELYLRLLKTRLKWSTREQFFSAAVTLMRRILIEHARRKKAAKRGGGERPTSLTAGEPRMLIAGKFKVIDVIALDQALGKLEPRSQLIVQLKFFLGLTHEEIGAALSLSSDTVKKKWLASKASLLRILIEEDQGDIDSSDERPP